MSLISKAARVLANHRVRFFQLLVMSLSPCCPYLSVPKNLIRTCLAALKLPRSELVGFGANPFGDCVQRYKQSKRTTCPS